MSSTIIIEDVLPYTQSIASASQQIFDTNWTSDVASDVLVYARADGVEPDDVTQLVSSNDYNVTFVGAEQYVRVTFLSGRTLDDVITITRLTPVDRENLYTNTNFLPSMLNGDFGRQTLMQQERELLNVNITPRYNTSATIEAPLDVILPILGANETWRKNDSNTAFEAYELPNGGIAPADASYVTVEDESASLPNSNPLSDKGTGFLVNLPSLSSFATRQILGTSNQIDVDDGTGESDNPRVSIVENAILPGLEGIGIPNGTTAQRPGSPTNISLRFNTDLEQLEYFNNGDWTQIQDSGDFGDLAALTFIVKEADALIPNAQSIGDLTTGILKNTVAGTVGTLSISAPLTSIDGLTTVANNLIYTTAADTYAVISSAIGGVLITDNAGSPSWLANPAVAGRILQSGNSAAATWSTPTYPSASGSAGNIIRSDGTNNVYSTATFADTYAINTLLYASALDTIAGLAPSLSSVLVSDATSTGVPTWIGPMTNGQLIIGSTGATPVAATLTAGSGISIANNAGSITISAGGGGYGWTEVTGTSQAMAVNSAYIANNAGLVTLTLPDTAAIGDTIIIQGKGAGLFRIAQNAGETIHLGSSSTTTGVGGSLTATNQYDSIELVCITANTDWACLTGPQGNFTVV